MSMIEQWHNAYTLYVYTNYCNKLYYFDEYALSMALKLSN